MSADRPALAMLARGPRAAGKTRLTAALDDTTALALRAALLLDTLASALAVEWPLHLFVTPAEDIADVQTRLCDDADLAPHAARVALHSQGAGDLGARMLDAVARTSAAGHDVVVLVGSDIPDLPLQVVVAAASAVGREAPGRALAFGPAADGGFYLVAASSPDALAPAFAGMTWSHPQVLADVTTRAHEAGLHVSTVAPWHDLDTPADLAALLARTSTLTGLAPRTRRVAAAISPYNGHR